MKLLQRLKNLFLPEGKISDGFHSFDELYHYRMLYNAAFFNSLEGKYEVHKSYRHSDGELCFGGGWFIVMAYLPTGASRSSNYKKLWIVDIDSKDDEYRNRIISLINECRGAEGDRIKHIIPTVNGYHLISNGFDRQQFSQKLALYQLDQIDIHDNNPTLLYYKTLC